ncbi:hypothetical protein IAT38_007640 [Cryptococcus sp. DSM 104549]
MLFAQSTLLATLLLASSAAAQRYTTTLDVDDGDTLVLSRGTNARGATITTTLSTITSGATAATTTRRTTTADDDDDDTTTSTSKKTTTTAQRVGDVTSYAPMRTTTYWVDTGNGYWTDYTWTAPTTTAPTVATANVPEGTVQDYAAYQSAVNSVVFASAEAAAVNATSGSMRRTQLVGSDNAVYGWMTMFLGAVGAGLGVLAL